MEEDADQIVQLQALSGYLYALIARLRQEIEVLRERVTAAQISIMLLNRTLEEHDRMLYNVRVSYRVLHLAHEEHFDGYILCQNARKLVSNSRMFP